MARGVRRPSACYKLRRGLGQPRPVPWKRLFTFVGIYSLIVFGLFAVLKPDQMLRSLPGLVFGALVGPDGDGGADQVRLAAHHAASPGPRWPSSVRSSRPSGTRGRQPRSVRQGGLGRLRRRPGGRRPAQAGADQAHHARPDQQPSADQGHPQALSPLPVVIAIDAGTTGVRSRAVFTDGRALDRVVPRVHPALPPARLGRARRGRDLGGRARPPCSTSLGQLDEPVAAIGITNQRETVVAWDRRTGTPLAPGHRVAGPAHRGALRRARPRPAHLPLVRERTGLVLDPYFSGTKMAWLLTPEPRRRRRAGRTRPGARARSTAGCCGT